jgi:hypothetical protein
MPTYEIARDEWVTFFNGFSQQHQRWLVTIEVFDPDLGAQVEAQELALRGITADSDGDSIAINLGRTELEHLTHIISDPTHARLKQTEAGASEALEIESASGKTTLIRFRSVVLPETVDGIVLE